MVCATFFPNRIATVLKFSNTSATCVLFSKEEKNDSRRTFFFFFEVGLIGTEVVINELLSLKVPLPRRRFKCVFKFLKLGSKLCLINTNIFVLARVCLLVEGDSTVIR